MRTTQLLSLAGLPCMLAILLPTTSAQQGQPIAGYQLLRPYSGWPCGKRYQLGRCCERPVLPC
jgi:hypothetical protein